MWSVHEHWGSWQISLQAHSWLSLKGQGNWGRFLRSGRKQMSLLSPRSSRRVIEGTTGQSASPGSLGRWWSKISQNPKNTKDKMIGSSQHGFMKGKLCLTILIVFYNETIRLVGEGKALMFIFTLAKHSTLSPITASSQTNCWYMN